MAGVNAGLIRQIHPERDDPVTVGAVPQLGSGRGQVQPQRGRQHGHQRIAQQHVGGRQARGHGTAQQGSLPCAQLQGHVYDRVQQVLRLTQAVQEHGVLLVLA